MLFSGVTDDGGKAEPSAPVDNSHEYQTANELFELMAKNQNFNTDVHDTCERLNRRDVTQLAYCQSADKGVPLSCLLFDKYLMEIFDGSSLTPRELVLLYKNIDRGTRLMSYAKDSISTSNQRVETVVYQDVESDSSDLNEIYSNEDLQSVILINKEQMDFLSSQPSVENTLCHKFGDLELQTSINKDYEQHLLFHDSCIKEQLKNVNLFSMNKEVDCFSALPPSLLDYVCCRRLENNYNFYMDNIIRYVKNTIEQLKRISNGDYLTARAKEKWKEVEHAEHVDNNTKVLATSASIPLHVECKIDGLKSTWDDIVHSAVDVRSLSKILEKKIFVEIPKFINGSYTLLSKRCNDNLIISCKKDNQTADESRVDVVLRLKRSETGHVISKISSIMFLQTTPVVQGLQIPNAPLALTYDEVQKTNSSQEGKELNSTSQDCMIQDSEDLDYETSSDYCDYTSFDSIGRNAPALDSSQFDVTDSRSTSVISCSQDETQMCNTQKEASFDIRPTDLGMTIKRLSIQSTLPEEVNEDLSQLPTKKKSLTRTRIKSPYENQSYVMEEKKRRKLLEIREKRERRKKAMMESFKITKHKYDNRGPIPQASTSVTKLSITNKSFYNSIYGHSTNVDTKQTKNKNRKRDLSKDVSDIDLQNCGSEANVSETPSEVQCQKFTNRSYYLDNAETAMMYMNRKRQAVEKEIPSPSTSGASCDIHSNLNMLSELMIPFESVPNEITAEPVGKCHSMSQHLLMTLNDDDDDDADSNEEATTDKNFVASQSILNIVPSNTPKMFIKTDNDAKKITVECRKSIDKIYQLMNKMDKKQSNSGSKSQNTTSTTINDSAICRSSSTQESESGTSLKHQTSSSPSTFSFDKQNNNEGSLKKDRSSTTAVTPKVIISSKSQIPQNSDIEKNKKDRKVSSATTKARDKNNPLKAISQLLHDFENVQRNRTKPRPEHKSIKRAEISISNDGKNNPRLGSPKRRSRLEEHHETMDTFVNKIPSPRPATGINVVKVPFQQIPIDTRYPNRNGRKKIADMLDEAKEARGEAVRGPSKFNSRLNSLAQPKKSYVQAHSEEYQTRYGRNLMTDRLQRLAGTPGPLIPDKTPRLVNPRNRMKRPGNEAVSPASLKLPFQSGLPIERVEQGTRPRYSNSSSPDNRNKQGTVTRQSCKQVNVPEPPKILKKKMNAVESYVKNHYGRALFSSPVADKPQIPQKLRAPVLPSDIDTESNASSQMLEESTEVGSKLHTIIESMLNNTTQGLEVLTECFEVNYKSSKDNFDDVSINVNYSRCDGIISFDSDFTSNATEVGIRPIGNLDKHTVYVDEEQDTISEKVDVTKCDLQPFVSATELDKKEELVLSRPLSVRTFPKYMTLNKLNLTPKSSIQQLLLLQGGDAGSLVVKTALSQSKRLTNSKPMQVVSKTYWDFPVIPKQITVAYALSEFEVNKHQDTVSPSLTRLFQQVSKTTTTCSPINRNMANNSVMKDNNFITSFMPIVSSLDQETECSCFNNEKVQPVECEQYTDIARLNPTVLLKDVSCYNNAPPEITSHINNKPIVTPQQEATADKEQIKTVIKNETKLTQTSLKENNESDITSKNSETVDYTTSLDILVGLLNEIQKISTCQTNMTRNETEDSKELEIIANKTPGVVDSIRSSYNLSITSIDKLRCLESNQSIYSFYISDGEVINDSKDKMFGAGIDSLFKTRHNKLMPKPMCADKEVSVDIAKKEHVDRITDVPSVFLPVAANHSTNMTNSMVLEELCQSSTRSLFSFTDYHSSYSNAPSIHSTYSDEYSNKVLKLLPPIMQMNDINKNIEYHQDVENVPETKPLKQKIRSFENYAIIQKRKIVKRSKNDYCLESTKFDPVMKLKRDILVTVYSMLVLIVFAALSFPEMLYHVV